MLKPRTTDTSLASPQSTVAALTETAPLDVLEATRRELRSRSGRRRRQRALRAHRQEQRIDPSTWRVAEIHPREFSKIMWGVDDMTYIWRLPLPTVQGLHIRIREHLKDAGVFIEITIDPASFWTIIWSGDDIRDARELTGRRAFRDNLSDIRRMLAKKEN